MSAPVVIKAGVMQIGDASRSPQVLPVVTATQKVSGPLRAAATHMPAEALAARSAASTLSAQQLDELASLRAAAVRQGYEEGYAKGVAEAQEIEREAAEAQNEAALRLLRQIDMEHQAQLTRLESLAADFAYQATCRLVGDAYVQPELALRLVRQALAEVPAASEVSIELHPADAAWIEAALGDLAFEHRHLRLSVVASQQVTLGGCRLHTAQGVLDARLETQLAALKLQLDEARQP